MDNWTSQGLGRLRRITKWESQHNKDRSPTSPSSSAQEKNGFGNVSTVSRNVEDPTKKGQWLTTKEYLLIGIEAILSLTVSIMIERYSALLSLVIGCLADSYVSHYTMALISVIFHIIGASITFIERTIEAYDGEVYENIGLPSNINQALLLLITSTDFTRLVYGLEGVSRKKKSIIHIFIFLQYWVSSSSVNGGVLKFFSSLVNGIHGLTFIGACLSLFLFIYVIPAMKEDPKGPERQFRETSRDQRLPYKVIKCLTLATLYKILRIRLNKGFLSNTEGTVDKITVSKTRDIIVLYAWLLPTLGLIFVNVFNATLFLGELLNRFKTGPVITQIGLPTLARALVVLAMPLSYFGIWPLLTKIGLRNKASIKLMIGYLLSALSFLFLALLFKSKDQLPLSGNNGFIRVFNSRKFPVKLASEERQLAVFEDLYVQPKEGILLSLHNERPKLYPVRLFFNGTKTNFTTLLSLVPGETTGYILMDPPQVTRIRGPFLPLREGPPGTNIIGWPRIFIYNTARMYQDAHVRIKQHGKLLRDFKLGMSIMTTTALPYGTYDIDIKRASLKKTANFGQGGVYGIFIHATTVTREMDLDTVVKPASSSTAPFLIFCFFWGLAHGIAYPTLRGIIFDNAPEGLVATSFSFLTFLEGLCLWIQFIGFKTWHYYVTPDTVIAYAVIAFLLFFICAFIYFKYSSISW